MHLVHFIETSTFRILSLCNLYYNIVFVVWFVISSYYLQFLPLWHQWKRDARLSFLTYLRQPCDNSATTCNFVFVQYLQFLLIRNSIFPQYLQFSPLDSCFSFFFLFLLLWMCWFQLPHCIVLDLCIVADAPPQFMLLFLLFVASLWLCRYHSDVSDYHVVGLFSIFYSNIRAFHQILHIQYL